LDQNVAFSTFLPRAIGKFAARSSLASLQVRGTEMCAKPRFRGVFQHFTPESLWRKASAGHCQKRRERKNVRALCGAKCNSALVPASLTRKTDTNWSTKV
jgi:hypothetical protein